MSYIMARKWQVAWANIQPGGPFEADVRSCSAPDSGLAPDVSERNVEET